MSILHDFDPLNESNNEEEEEIYWSSQKSNFSESFYDTNDPFSYMEQQVLTQDDKKDNWEKLIRKLASSSFSLAIFTLVLKAKFDWDSLTC